MAATWRQHAPPPRTTAALPAVSAQICKHQKARTEPEPAAKHASPGTSRTRLQVQDRAGPESERHRRPCTGRPAESPPFRLHSHTLRAPNAPNGTNSRDTSTNNHRPTPTSTSTAAPGHLEEAGTLAARRGGQSSCGCWQHRRGVGGNNGENSRVGSEAALSVPTQSEMDAFVLWDRK